MLKNKFSSLVFIISILIFYISCVSKPIPIPGDKKAQISNIYVEYLNIADVFYSQEKFDKAINYYIMASSYEPLNNDCFYKLAKAYAAQSNWDKSLEMFLKLSSDNPENNSLKESVAYIYAMKGEIEASLKIYNDLISLNPENLEYWENYIAVLLLNEDIDTVQVPFLYLIENFPDSKKIENFQKQIDIISNAKTEKNKQSKK